MPATKLSSNDKARLLRNVPDGTTRVQVTNSAGKVQWKKPIDVAGTDTLVFNKDGNLRTMQGKPGRKSKVALQPLDDDIAEIVEAKEEHIETDPLLQVLQNDPESDSVLDMVMLGLAEESASLEFERHEAERHGRDTSTHSLRRSRVLKATGDMFLKRKEQLVANAIDLDSPAFETLFKFMMETFRESMTEANLRPEHVETVFSKLSKRLESGWKEEARARIREGK